MKRISNIFVVVVLFLFSNIGVASSAGSGGYRLELPDAGPMGMGSAFVAQADRPSAVYYNPAGLIQLKDKNYISLGTGVIQPFSTHKDSSGNKTERRTDRFVVPHAYGVSDFGLSNFSFGLGVCSFWGLGTDWAEDSFSRYVATKSDLETKDVLLAGAFKVSDSLSLGLSLDYAHAYVNKKKKLIQLGGADGDFQLKGIDNDSWGYRLALLYKLSEKHQFGFVYRSPIKVKYRGKAYLNELNAAGSNYQAIFGGSSYETEFSSESTLPQSIVFGYCYKPSEKWTFEADVEWMDWASTEQEWVIFGEEKNSTRLSVLNAGNPVAKDWDSVFSFGVGAQYEVSDNLRLRGGYFYHETPIPNASFDTALPDSDSHSITVGIGHDFNEKMTLDLAYSAMFFEKRVVDNDIGSSSGASIDGEYSAFTNLYVATFTYSF